MKTKQACEICGMFKEIGFTDCGLICTDCFSKEQQISAFNMGVEKSAEIAEKESTSIAKNILAIKMETHQK